MALVNSISMISEVLTMPNNIQMSKLARRPKMRFLVNSLILLKITSMTSKETQTQEMEELTIQNGANITIMFL